jgi:ABC-2 type transport system permease protein
VKQNTLQSLGALYLANAKEFLRDRMTVFLVMLLPLALAAFFGALFGGVEGGTLRAIDLHLSGLLGVAMIWKGLFSTTAKVGQLRQRQVLRRLCLTPLAPITFLAGQAAWSLTVGLIQAALFVLVGRVAYGVRIAGSKPLFLASVVLGSLVSTAMGYCLANLFASAEAGAVAIQLINFPMIMLSGSLFAIETLPATFRPLAAIMPLTYLNDALRQTMVGAPPLHPLWIDFAVLGGWLLGLLLVTVRRWRWE